jgi:hypothetical protein
MQRSRVVAAVFAQVFLAGLFLAHYGLHDDAGLLPWPWEAILLVSGTLMTCLLLRRATNRAREIGKRAALAALGPGFFSLMMFLLWPHNFLVGPVDFVVCSAVTLILASVLFAPGWLVALLPPRRGLDSQKRDDGSGVL